LGKFGRLKRVHSRPCGAFTGIAFGGRGSSGSAGMRLFRHPDPLVGELHPAGLRLVLDRRGGLRAALCCLAAKLFGSGGYYALILPMAALT
jgi:hypothetical protein